MDGDQSLALTDAEISRAFSDPKVTEQFPPVLNIEQASRLVQIPVGTLRDWRSRGLLANCSRKAGREVRFWRDRLIKNIFNDGI